MEEITYTLYSGGANGSDAFIGNIAKLLGYTVIHFYPIGVRCPFGNTEVSNLETGIQMCKNVQNYLGKNAPKHFPSKELCARDWSQVEKSQLIIAIGSLTKDKRNVQGGTGWAVAMGIWLRLPILLIDNETDTLYTYDYFTKRQFVKNHIQIVLKKLSTVKISNVTGIGTRNLIETKIKSTLINTILKCIKKL